MKRLLGLLLLAGVIYGGYLYYRQSTAAPTFQSETPATGGNLILSDTTAKIDNFASVLGASISNTFENGKEILNNATSGKSEPIINQLVTKTQETLKDLPQKEAEKIKYEFCRGVIEEYEGVREETP